MLLAVVIGNTNVQLGVFINELLIVRWRLATHPLRTADEYIVQFRSLFDMWDLEIARVTGVIMGSVVPSHETVISQMARTHLGVVPLSVSTELDLGITVTYTSPLTLGADRLANVVGAARTVGAPVIVVDCGTATTLDVLAAEKIFVGGAIAPGLEISQEALVARTAQLPEVPLEPPSRAIGTNTRESLQSGILYGHAGLIDGLIRRTQVELGAPAKVVVTGGLATVVGPHLKSEVMIDPDLTLRGLQSVYARNRPTSSAKTSLRQDQSLA